MRLRTVQFACFVVLLSAFSAAATRNPEDCRPCAALHVLLAQVAAVSASEAAPGPSPFTPADARLPAAARTHAVQPWSMQPAVAQTAQIHAVTGSGL